LNRLNNKQIGLWSAKIGENGEMAKGRRETGDRRRETGDGRRETGEILPLATIALKG
jgi:hypothetical protein